MNSLLLSLALTAPQTALAHPPGHHHRGGPPPVVVALPVPPPVVVVPGRPAFRPVGFQPPPVVMPAPPSFYQPPPPPIAVPAPQAPMTLEHFAKCFQPTPGTHHVCIIHPVTCRPVSVCFTLPAGCGCPKVCAHRRSIEFDYGRREVEINFRRNGSVDVDY